MATKASSAWTWVLEALASCKELDASAIIDLFSKASKIPNIVRGSTRELVALKVLESLFPEAKTAGSLSSPPDSVWFDLSLSCEDVLMRILKETLHSSLKHKAEKLKWKVQPFITFKRSSLEKCGLDKLKEAILDGRHPFLASLKQRSSLLLPYQSGNRIDHDVDDGDCNELSQGNQGTDVQVVDIKGASETESPESVDALLQVKLLEIKSLLAKRGRNSLPTEVTGLSNSRQVSEDNGFCTYLNPSKKVKQDSVCIGSTCQITPLQLSRPRERGHGITMQCSGRKGYELPEALLAQGLDVRKIAEKGLAYGASETIGQTSNGEVLHNPKQLPCIDNNLVVSGIDGDELSKDDASERLGQRPDVYGAIIQYQHHIADKDIKIEVSSIAEDDLGEYSASKRLGMSSGTDSVLDYARFIIFHNKQQIPCNDAKMVVSSIAEYDLGKHAASERPGLNSSSDNAIVHYRQHIPGNHVKDIYEGQTNGKYVDDSKMYTKCCQDERTLNGVSEGDGEDSSNSELSRHTDNIREEIADIGAKKNALFSKWWRREGPSSRTCWKKSNLCMKCNKGGQLLVCSSDTCQFVIHDSCCSANIFDIGEVFYCPFCRYSRLISEFQVAQKKASLARNDLEGFLGLEMKSGPAILPTDLPVSEQNAPSQVKHPDKKDKDRNKSRGHYMLRVSPRLRGTTKDIERAGCSVSHGTDNEDHKSISLICSKRFLNQAQCPTNFPVPQLRRQKVPWTQEEEKILKEAVEKFSKDNDGWYPWKMILEYGRSVFKESRTALDLKDKWRNLCKKNKNLD